MDRRAGLVCWWMGAGDWDFLGLAVICEVLVIVDRSGGILKSCGAGWCGSGTLPAMIVITNGLEKVGIIETGTVHERFKALFCGIPLSRNRQNI